MESKLLVLLDNEEIEIDTRHKGSLLEYFNKHKIVINQSCGGNGTCGTCQIKILQGQSLLNERNETENEMFSDRGFDASQRLACQTHLNSSEE